jgi:flagellar hook-associated protein 1 FlgK
MRTPQGVFGSGVVLAGISRTRDETLDAAFRRDTARTAGSTMTRDLLGGVEAVFNEPSEAGLGASLDAVWDSWVDLANAPASASAKTVVRQRGEQLAERLRAMNGQLDDAVTDVRARLGQSVRDINSFGEQIASLNDRIRNTEITGQRANDLRDARDLAVDKLAKIAPVRVIEAADGAATVILGGTTLVDTDNPRRFELVEVGGKTVLSVAGTGRGVADTGGAMSAMLGALNGDIPATRAKLDAIADALVTTVNGMHRRGFSRAGEAAGAPADWTNADPALRGSRVDFFDPAPGARTARGISLSAFVAADAGAVATGYTRDGDGDNQLALDAAALRERGGVVGGQSIAAFYRDAVADVATRVNAADRDATAGETLVAQADTRRQSVSGVSTDEELIALMKHQQAYSAAARLIKVADEMTQELLSLVR